MVQPAIRHDRQIVDLVSDDEADGFSDDSLSLHDAQFVREQYDDEVFPDLDELDQYEHCNIENPDIIDLTAIPDIDVPPSEHNLNAVEDSVPIDAADGAQLITEAVCLRLVLDVFPDVSIDHVLTMIQERTTDLTRTKEHSERIVNELLEGTYPKEADVASKKRRREDSVEINEYEDDERDMGPPAGADAIELLKDEFLHIPVRHITHTFKTHKTLFRTYIVLEEQLRNYRQVSRTFNKTPRPRTKRGVELLLIEVGNRLPKELRAAKKKVESEAGKYPDPGTFVLQVSTLRLTEAVKRRKIEETKAVEEANLQQAQMDKTMGECQCCFTEYPLNRMISCSGKDMHLFCMNCPKQYIETEMGQSKCRPKCFASTECKGTFSRAQLQQVLDAKSFERLEHMQQQQDIAAAGLDFLSECPFCDFKAECPPVEEDKEFRCQNTKCGKTSCRLCDKETHIPLSCEEAKKDGQLTLRHVVEEAMSAALIRKCNNCQRPFIKDYGCNKMSCSHCGNKQCYLCSKDVNNYEHFGDPNKGRCALHDNVEETHEQAVKKAADDAMAQVRAENPGLSDADLMVQVSDRVKQAEAARKGRAAERLNEFPYQMMGDQLAHRPGFLVPPPLPGDPPVPPPPGRYVHPFPEYDDPLFPPFLEDEPDYRFDARDSDDEPDFGDFARDDYIPHRPQPVHDPFRRRWRLPPPPAYVFDPASGIFRNPVRAIFFDPNEAHSRPNVLPFHGLVAGAGPAGHAALINPPVPHHPQRLPQQGAALPQAQPQLRAHRHFQNAIDPLGPLEPRVQAAQDRFQRQLQEANRANGHVGRDAHAAEQDARRLRRLQRLQEPAAREQAREANRRAHVQEMDARFQAVRARWDYPPLPAPPAFGNNGPQAVARNAGANAGVGGGLAFGGLDANRAVGRHPFEFDFDFEPPPWRDAQRQ
ncbi:ring finger domain-containing protein [Stagonosporopsis vannaccii]|nr:ring finger domain-containing protein [Stagonosporopsis vannaccii]